MKRSRAPSTTRGANTRAHSAAQQSINAHGHGTGGGAVGVGARGAHGPGEEESQHSLEVDVGMENASFTDPAPDTEAECAAASKADAGSKRRHTRGPRRGRGEASASMAREEASNEKADSATTRTLCKDTHSGAQVGKARGRAGGRGGGGVHREEGAGNEKCTSPSVTSQATATTGTTATIGGGDASKDAESDGGRDAKQETLSSEGNGADDGGAADVPPPKKKKKYIRNPETHKAYRARMEGELAQARKMLEDANKAMVELARDYKRQQAIIEKYRVEDNSLLSTSQLTLSQLSQTQGGVGQPQHHSPVPSYSHQLHPQALAAQTPYSPQPSGVHPQQHLSSPGPGAQVVSKGSDASAGGSSVGVTGGAIERTTTLEAALLGGSQESIDKGLQEPEMGELTQDVGVGLSQTSAISLVCLETEEPLSQVTQWIAAFQESQEEWNFDDILIPEEGGDAGKAHAESVAGENDTTNGENGEIEGGPDSVEAVALAAEALSPSGQESSLARISSAQPTCSPDLAQAATVATSGNSAMRGTEPQLPLLSGGHAGGMSPQAAIIQQASVLAAGNGGVVRVGVACLVTNPKKPGCVLVGRRKGTLGAGTLGLPGGHLEIGEDWPACAAREVLEETGLEVETPTFAWVINSPNMEEGKHCVTIFMLAAVSDEKAEPKLMEPAKCEGWTWAPWKSLGARKSSRSRGSNDNAIKGPLFRPLAILRATTYSPFRGVL